MPTTEIATLTLAPGSDIGDPNNNASRIVNECGNVLAKQPGLLALRFGPLVEDGSKMEMVIDWETKQKHEDFMASEAYPPFLEKFKSIMAGPPAFKHVDFDGDLVGATKAPVTEVATFHFHGTTPENYTKGVQDFIQLCISKSPNQKVHGYATGVTHEEIEREGVKGKGGVLVIGWDSVEQHMEFRQTDVFQQNRESMRQGAGAIEVHHTTLLNFVPS